MEFEAFYVSALKIIGKDGLSFEVELVCRRSCMLPRRGSGPRLENELSAVVWSLAESWLGGGGKHLERVRRVMDTPVYRVPCSSTLLYRVMVVSWRSVLTAAVVPVLRFSYKQDRASYVLQP